MAYDINGNYIMTEQDLKNQVAKVNNSNFKSRVEKFLTKNNISGSATTYGFSTTKKDAAIEALNKLGVKYTVDYSNFWNVKIVISKKSI